MNACMPSDVVVFKEDVSDQHGIDAEIDDRHQSIK